MCMCEECVSKCVSECVKTRGHHRMSFSIAYLIFWDVSFEPGARWFSSWSSWLAYELQGSTYLWLWSWPEYWGCNYATGPDFRLGCWGSNSQPLSYLVDTLSNKTSAYLRVPSSLCLMHCRWAHGIWWSSGTVEQAVWITVSDWQPSENFKS